MIAPMQALERLWDRPALRWPFTLVAVFVLFAGLRTAYVQTRSTGTHGPVVKGGQPRGIAVYGPRIKLPEKAVHAGKAFIRTAVLRTAITISSRSPPPGPGRILTEKETPQASLC